VPGSRIRKPTGWRARAARLAATAGTVLALITSGTAFAGGAAGQAAQAAQLASAPPPAALAALYCRTLTNCVAIGANNPQNPTSLVMERWNGVRWSRSALPASAGAVNSSVSPASVACPTARECVAVGLASDAGGPLVEYWNGSRWSLGQAAAPNGSPSGLIYFVLTAISCPAPRDCYAVGSFMGVGSTETNPLIEHWNGSTWSVQTEGGMGAWLTGISCRTTAFCVAVGSGIEGSGPIADVWNGRTWTGMAVPWAGPVQISGVTCPATTSCFAVGSYLIGNGSLVERWNGKTWSAAHTPGPAASVSQGLASVSCASPVRCLAVGNYAGDGVYAVAWNGLGWHRVAVAPVNGRLGYVEQVQCPSATRCVALGATNSNAATQRFESAFWNGRTWRVVPTA
jgi:hypothetical protein